MTPREAGETAFYECEGNNSACLEAAFDAYEAVASAIWRAPALWIDEDALWDLVDMPNVTTTVHRVKWSRPGLKQVPLFRHPQQNTRLADRLRKIEAAYVDTIAPLARESILEAANSLERSA